jgi:hypothetical protein
MISHLGAADSTLRPAPDDDRRWTTLLVVRHPVGDVEGSRGSASVVLDSAVAVVLD